MVAPAGGHHLGRVEPRVGPQTERPGRTGSAYPPGQLVDEPLRPPPGVRRPLPLADMEDLAGIGPGGHQRMQTQHPGVAVGGALLVVTVNLANRRVHIDGHWTVTRAGPGRPGPSQDLAAELIQLADVAESKTAQERPTRRSRHGLMPEHRLSGASPEDPHVVDAVAVRHDGLSQGQDLPTRPGRTRAITEIDQSVR